MGENYYLAVEKDQTLADLQLQFSRRFPFLKIEFFREPCVKGKGTSKDKMMSSNVRLSQLLQGRKTGKLIFNEESLVSELEKSFYVRFGICMQVFRKSGNVWLETTSTDDWSLGQQNEEGRSLAQHFKIEKDNPEDHDIY
jgi:hypothetical protein